MKFFIISVIILIIGSIFWFSHYKTVRDQKKKSEICLNQSKEDLKQVRVGLDTQLNQQEFDKVGAKFQDCLGK